MPVLQKSWRVKSPYSCDEDLHFSQMSHKVRSTICLNLLYHSEINLLAISTDKSPLRSLTALKSLTIKKQNCMVRRWRIIRSNHTQIRIVKLSPFSSLNHFDSTIHDYRLGVVITVPMGTFLAFTPWGLGRHLSVPLNFEFSLRLPVSSLCENKPPVLFVPAVSASLPHSHR